MNPWLILGALGVLVAASRKGGGSSGSVNLPDIDLSIATEARFKSLNNPTGTYIHKATGTEVPEYNPASMSLGITRSFEWADLELGPIPTKIDHTDAAIEATAKEKPWGWSKSRSLSFLRNLPYGAIAWGISEHESGGNPYAINSNTNGSLDLGLCQINDTVIHDPSNWTRCFGNQIKGLGLYAALCPWLNLGACTELLAFWDGGKGRGIADLLCLYAGWNQFLVTPHQPYYKTLSLIALANDIFK